MSNQMTQPTTSELLAAMALATNLNNSTDQWDIVCSYTEDRVNELLKKNHAAGLLLKEVKFSGEPEYNDATDSYFVYDYEMILDAPQITFLDQSRSCRLTMPIISGHYTVTPSPQTSPPTLTRRKDMPSGHYSFVADVPLGAVSGDGKVTESGVVVDFSSPNETATVVLHFNLQGDPSEGGEVSFMLQPQSKETATERLSQHFQTYFLQTVKEIDYALTAVNNASPQGASGVTIIPKKFMFRTTAGVLSIYIRTENSGILDDGNQDPVFRPGGREMAPVPQGYTASLIFSRELIKQVYLEPGLAGFGAVTYDDTVPSGIALYLTYNKRFECDLSFRLPDLELISDVVELDFVKQPYHINIQGDQASIEWNFSQRVSWLLTSYKLDMDTREREPDLTETGKATVTVKLKKNKTEHAALSDTSFDISFDIQASDYEVKVTGKGGFMSYENDFKKALKDKLKKANLPSIKIDPGALQYFAATNLLIPGKQMLKIDPKAGVQIPFDLILLGDVIV